MGRCCGCACCGGYGGGYGGGCDGGVGGGVWLVRGQLMMAGLIVWLSGAVCDDRDGSP